MDKKWHKKMTALRHQLHRIPETAFAERQTAAHIEEFLKAYRPTELVNGLGGTGIAAVFTGKAKGPTLMFRCELDALPIAENNDVEYRSTHKGNGHQCGHDGHMAMVAGLAPLLAQEPLPCGRVILLFQPAEETGQGAQKVLEDPQFEALQPDYIFALHNLPGYARGQIVCKKDTFASASRGMIVKLTGAPSHASHPENGRNPALAVSQITAAMLAIPTMHTPFGQAALITPIHLKVGQPAFGTSPGDGEVMFTLRSHQNDAMQALIQQAEHTVHHLAKAYKLHCEISYTENFDAVENAPQAQEKIEAAAQKLGQEVHYKPEPFAWSEDFGIFTAAFPGAMFGLGSGEEQPQLHNEDYNFPDEILPQGTALFWELVRELLK